MNKKAFTALLIAVLIPVTSYLILKNMSDKVVNMPRKYLLDSVSTYIKNGKEVNDSIWHKTANITLINHLGDTVHLNDIQGKMIVIDFFFTRCGSICPRLTKSMMQLQQSFLKGGNVRNKIDTNVVQFLSFTIDPANDSVATLKNYANRFGINSDNWWLLTGNRDSIYNFAFEELKVDKFSNEPVSPEFPHTARFVLLDKEHYVRGYYDGLNRDSASLSKLARDIGLLMLEKNKKKPSTVFTEIISLSWLWLLALLIITGFVWYLNKLKNKTSN